VMISKQLAIGLRSCLLKRNERVKLSRDWVAVVCNNIKKECRLFNADKEWLCRAITMHYEY